MVPGETACYRSKNVECTIQCYSWLVQIGVPRDLKHAVLGVDIVMGENLYGYNHNKQSAFLKVTIAVPKLVGIGESLFFVSSDNCLCEIR